MLLIEQAFAESEQNLWYEFLETLINDEDVPKKLRRQIWAFATMEVFYNNTDNRAIPTLIQQEFGASTDCEDLCVRWQKIVDSCWSMVPNCPLKIELDALE